MKSLNASAVVAKPPGTETPRSASWPIISPSEEFLPPTWARSDRRRSCNQRMLLVQGGGSVQAAGCRAMAPWAAHGDAEVPGFSTDRRPRQESRWNAVRPVFYVSDGTGITAETIGHSLLTQFSGVRFSSDRAAVRGHAGEGAGGRRAHPRRRRSAAGCGRSWSIPASTPTSTLLLAESGALMLDVFAPFIEPLEQELGRSRAGPDRPRARHRRFRHLPPPHQRDELRADPRRRRQARTTRMPT